MANNPVSTRGVNNTAFSPNADMVAQMTGSGQPVPGSVSPTFAATQDITSILRYSRYVELLGVNATSSTATVTTSFVATPGARLVVNCRSTTTGTVTYTFSTGFKVVGTVAATSSTNFPISFVSNGTAWVETGRPTAAIAD